MRTPRPSFAAVLGTLLILAAAVVPGAAGPALAQTAGRDVQGVGPVEGNVPGNALSATNNTEIWRAVRRGIQGTVSIPDKQAGVMIQSEGDNWRALRNGPLTVYGAWAMLGTIGLVALFFVVRGRIRIDAGPAGRTIERFNGVERFSHWLSAVSFVLLALTGLNLLYGRHVLLPVLGPEAFATIAQAGKYAHNFISFSFMLGLVLMFVLWVGHNIPNRHDLVWLAKGGGLFVKNVHPPSRKFNAGQKLIFWAVILGGSSLALSGIALMFPFQLAIFSPTFAALNVFGLGLPTDLAPVQEMQLSQLWHTVVGLVMIAIIVAHIYIGSLGMEGAFAAMGSGQVDVNWAREHHDLWYGEATGETDGGHAAHRAAE